MKLTTAASGGNGVRATTRMMSCVDAAGRRRVVHHGGMAWTAAQHRSLTDALARAGCVAAAEEAAALWATANGDVALLDALVERRCNGEPLAWITERALFSGLDVRVVPGVYVPRVQSEPLARRAASLLPRRGIAVDLCTGAGAIALVLQYHAPEATVIGTEIDPVAVACARSNGVEVLAGDLDEALPGELEHRVDVMTAVVPYVPSDALPLLPRDVRAFEPRAALDGGPNGARVLMEVVRRSPRWLRTGGRLLLELGGDQAQPVGTAMVAHGFEQVSVIEDDDGDVRGVAGSLT
jgi:release factor glutamine methyltransferase